MGRFQPRATSFGELERDARCLTRHIGLDHGASAAACSLEERQLQVPVAIVGLVRAGTMVTSWLIVENAGDFGELFDLDRSRRPCAAKKQSRSGFAFSIPRTKSVKGFPLGSAVDSIFDRILSTPA
jgi:hypothetical protein